ncbi:HypC/HybG/HupF family hydrogenase formation chaperone [Patescibacteria group bacterium]|nr:HypC/HybG/HupF family hydrogenase formation chaperone [Patescibacteria group bacterium]MBU4458769.1 HypC/HybG/HupF family hydrogenase formation chaperone [Patescibacteria group bacterium]MCG2696070.1 HypC/HybG/HupF family hydrogenase formation chaperone [Candidatus Portnoybacteria bacterium]
MCLSNPTKILKIKNDKAVVEMSGKKKEVGTRLVSGIKKGDYCLVSNGFIIKKISNQQAKEINALFKKILRGGKK